ncbi:hypothetical protein [Terrihabitans sp. B22-R8]|uniref:hypothetical protein n=1 Tax=Terrihabitans sp. B22-R8 TaxID=3425128 RepID=UPI00403C86CE
MGFVREGAFAIAFGSVRDAIRSLGAIPTVYLAIFALFAVQSIAMYREAAIEAVPVGTLVVAVFTGFGSIPFIIKALRYFADGDAEAPLWSWGRIGRFLLWPLLLTLAIGIPIGVVFFLVGRLFATGEAEPGPGMLVAGLAIVPVFFAFLWLGLRLSTLYVVLARGEDRPIRRSFADTRGQFWFIFRTFLVAMLVLIAVFAVYGAGLFLTGMIDLAEEPAPLSGIKLFAGGIADGLLQIVVVSYFAALYGRLFRNLRGLPPLFARQEGFVGA